MTSADAMQATLLDDYCAALHRDPQAPSPALLDADLAALARRLVRQASPEPGEEVLAAIRRRVIGDAPMAPMAPTGRALPRSPLDPFAPLTTLPRIPSPSRRPATFTRSGGGLAFLILAAFVGVLALVLPRLGAGTPGGLGGVVSSPPATSGAVAPARGGAGQRVAAPPTRTQSAVGVAYTATAGAKPAATAPQPPSAAPTPPADVITLAEARAAVRAFLGEPDAAFTGEYSAGNASLPGRSTC